MGVGYPEIYDPVYQIKSHLELALDYELLGHLYRPSHPSWTWKLSATRIDSLKGFYGEIIQAKVEGNERRLKKMTVQKDELLIKLQVAYSELNFYDTFNSEIQILERMIEELSPKLQS